MYEKVVLKLIRIRNKFMLKLLLRKKDLDAFVLLQAYAELYVPAFLVAVSKLQLVGDVVSARVRSLDDFVKELDYILLSLQKSKNFKSVFDMSFDEAIPADKFLTISGEHYVDAERSASRLKTQLSEILIYCHKEVDQTDDSSINNAYLLRTYVENSLNFTLRDLLKLSYA